MRSAEEIKKIIVDFASAHKRIRAVLLNGSRANPNVKPDKFQDFDIMFLVSGIKSFTSDLTWTDAFGKKILQQSPDEMVIGNDPKEPKRTFHYLMLFEDGNRIDLTLFPVERFESRFRRDSLTIVWLDKDGRFLDVDGPNEKDYFISKPTKKQYCDFCNEFWWVSTNLAKGLARNEIIYAKEMLEIHLRPVFMKMLEWYIGTQHSFSVSVGKGGKFLNKYLSKKIYDQIISTYAGNNLGDNWASLLTMMKLFSKLAAATATSLSFEYAAEEEKNANKYVRQLKKERIKKIGNHR